MSDEVKDDDKDLTFTQFAEKVKEEKESAVGALDITSEIEKVNLDESPNVQIGFIDSGDEFDVGIEQGSTSDAIIFMFKQNGEPVRALGFRGEAADKLLTNFYALLSLLYSTAVEQEELNADLNPKLKTLH